MENTGWKGYLKCVAGTCLCGVGIALGSAGYFTANLTEKTAYNIFACASVVAGFSLTYHALKKRERADSVGPDVMANDITYISVNEESGLVKQNLKAASR